MLSGSVEYSTYALVRGTVNLTNSFIISNQRLRNKNENAEVAATEHTTANHCSKQSHVRGKKETPISYPLSFDAQHDDAHMTCKKKKRGRK